MNILVKSQNKEFNSLVPKIRKIARQLGRFLGLENAHVEIYLVGNGFMEKNVLAFPAPKNFPRPDLKKGIKALGEIYLNPDYIAKERLEIPAKLAYMFIHGFLHLQGYDHKKKGDRIKMERKEAELLSKLPND